VSSKYIHLSVRLAVDPDKVDAVLWYFAEHLNNFTDVSGPCNWVNGNPEILGYTVDGNEWESPRYEV
jgi:hypothetical protein